MDFQRPNILGTRLPETILDRIYRLAAISDHPLSLDSSSTQLYPSILQASPQIHHHLLPTFLSENTFSLRRASLCAYEQKPNPNTTSPPHHNPPTHENPHHPTPLLPSIPSSHRAQIRHLRLETFNGARPCLNAALNRQHRNSSDATRMHLLRQKFPARDQRKRQTSCAFCNPFVFPDLLALFPRLRSVSINISANRDSEHCWASLCRALVRGREAVWVSWVGIGRGVLEAEGLGLEILVEDEKLCRVWRGVRGLGSGEVRDFVEFEWESEGVGGVLRVSERVALRLLRLWYWVDCVSLAGKGVLGLGMGMGGNDGGFSWDLRVRDERVWGTEALTAWNWALRQWLRRGGVNGRDYGYVRATEGGGVRNVVAAWRLEAVLLDAFERLAEIGS